MATPMTTSEIEDRKKTKTVFVPFVSRAKMKPKLLTFRRWKSIEFPAFHRELRSICWSPVLLSSSPDTAWLCCAELVVSILDHHAPLVTVNIRHKPGFGVFSNTRKRIRLTAAQLRTSAVVEPFRSSLSTKTCVVKCDMLLVRKGI